MNMTFIPAAFQVAEQHDAHVRAWARREALLMLDDAANAGRRAQWAPSNWTRVINKTAARFCVERARELRIANA